MAQDWRTPSGDEIVPLKGVSDGPFRPTCRQADHGWTRIGLRSDDVRSDCASLKAQGVRFLSEPVEFRPDVWIVDFRGPDGEVIELRESPEDPRLQGAQTRGE